MAVVPSRGRATRVEPAFEPEAEATRTLYERYSAQIYGYCLHQLGSREEAEDAVQSTFLNAFRGLQRGIVPELEQAWLFKIAQNVCLSRRRSSWRRGRIESPAAFELAEETAPAPHRRADELIGLQDVLENMPETQRRAILLREWQGLSYREIAEELELSQAAVETLIFRARRTLAQGLEASPAEQRSWRQKVRPSLGLGNVLTGLKSLFASGLAVKAAGTAAVVAVTSVAVGPPVAHDVGGSRHARARHAVPAPVVSHATAATTAVASYLTPAPAGPAAGRRRHHAQLALGLVTPSLPDVQTAPIDPTVTEQPPVAADPGVAVPPSDPVPQAPAAPQPAAAPPQPAAPTAAAPPQSAPPVVDIPTPKPVGPTSQPSAPGRGRGRGWGHQPPAPAAQMPPTAQTPLAQPASQGPVPPALATPTPPPSAAQGQGRRAGDGQPGPGFRAGPQDSSAGPSDSGRHPTGAAAPDQPPSPQQQLQPASQQGAGSAGPSTPPSAASPPAPQPAPAPAAPAPDPPGGGNGFGNGGHDGAPGGGWHGHH